MSDAPNEGKCMLYEDASSGKDQLPVLKQFRYHYGTKITTFSPISSARFDSSSRVPYSITFAWQV